MLTRGGRKKEELERRGNKEKVKKSVILFWNVLT